MFCTKMSIKRTCFPFLPTKSCRVARGIFKCHRDLWFRDKWGEGKLKRTPDNTDKLCEK